MKLLLSLILTFIGTFSYSQIQLSAVIIENETGHKVGNAIVAIQGTTFAVKTDTEGRFTFTDQIPTGEYVLTVDKEGYETKYEYIEVIDGKKVGVDQIIVDITKKERKRRKKAFKNAAKERNEKEKSTKKALDKAKKEKEKREKALVKKAKKNKKKKNVIEDVEADDSITNINYEPQENTSSTNHNSSHIIAKYGQILEVPSDELTNIKLYTFIEDWFNTPYLLGGATKSGVDCSSFTQRLYATVNDVYIERTAEKQFKSEDTDTFKGKEHLLEGDLLFFKGSGENSNNIVHVGVYLQNNKFVHATSYSKDTGSSGVKISSLNDPFWNRRFVSAGRRIVN